MENAKHHFRIVFDLHNVALVLLLSCDLPFIQNHFDLTQQKTWSRGFCRSVEHLASH